MNEHQNVIFIRNLFTAFLTGDVITILASISENAVWHFPGRKSQLAGDYVGGEAIIAFLAKSPVLSGKTFKIDLIDVVANDRTAVAIYRASGQRKGLDLDSTACLRMLIEDGKIIEFWEFVWDLYQVEEFWG